MDGARPGSGEQHGGPGGEGTGRSVELRDDRDQIEAAVTELLERMGAMGFDECSSFAVRLAVEEAINNGFRHGNKSNPDKLVRLSWRATPTLVEIQVRDEGEGFDPDSVPDPTAEENLEIPSGRGLMLMRSYMSEVEYVVPGNCVRMVYRR